METIQDFEYLKGKIINFDNERIEIHNTLGEGSSCVSYEGKADSVIPNVIVKEFVPKINEIIGRSCYQLYFDSNGNYYRILPSLREEFITAYQKYLDKNKKIENMIRNISNSLDKDSDKAKILRYIALPVKTYVYPQKNDKSTSEALLDSNNRFLYMTYYHYESKDLNKIINRFDIKSRLELVKNLCFVIGKFHKNNIIIVDLKPENFLYDKEGDIPYLKLFDFDSALEIDSTGMVKINEEKEVSGTSYFSAPEVLEKSISQIGIHSDIYSLGAILYYLLFNFDEEFINKIHNSNTLYPYEAYREIESQDFFDKIKHYYEDDKITVGFYKKLKQIIQKSMSSSSNFYIRYRSDGKKSAAELMENDIKALIEIYDNKGVHPEVMLNKAIERAKDIKTGDFKEELFTSIKEVNDEN